MIDLFIGKVDQKQIYIYISVINEALLQACL